MKTPNYKRGKYKMTDRKDCEVKVNCSKLFRARLKKLGEIKGESMSELIREAVTAHFNQTFSE
jgi:hypothetical protein